MSERRSKTILLVAGIWIVIAALAAVGYRFIVKPWSDDELAGETGSESRYSTHLRIAADSFSGYAILRSDELAAEMAQFDIGLTLLDDGADYAARMRGLRDRDYQMAIFTVDSFITSGAALGEYPASIVLVLDETKGADAIVAYEQAVKDVTDIDHASGRAVLTPNSPSEFLMRTVIAHFSLPSLSGSWIEEADGAADVYQRFRNANKQDRKVYVLWEPYVSRALEQPGAKVLIDSSKLKGHIVDVLVAERKFLLDNPELVTRFVESYLRTAYQFATDQSRLVKLVVDDARTAGGEALSDNQGRRLVEAILWKNTLENYGHFGLLDANLSRGVQHIEDIIRNITAVLLKTGALKSNPVAGKAHTLFFDRIVAKLQASGFHPARRLSSSGLDPSAAGELEAIRADVTLSKLTDAQWDGLVKVGEMRVKPISFARGAARINVQSRRELAELAQRLEAWPQYYLTVVGRARSVGDAAANQRLAEERAEAAIDALESAGVGRNRMRAKSVVLEGRGGAAQSVSFVVGQLPY